MTKQERTWEHSDGINDKSQKRHIFFLPTSDSFSIFCHYTCVCDISEHVSPKDIWRQLVCESRCNTDRNTFSFSSCDWGYLLNDSAHAIRFCCWKADFKWKSQVQTEEWTEYPSFLHLAIYFSKTLNFPTAKFTSTP
jgi:hypothetical protein